MTDAPHEPQPGPQPRPRRRRTVLVTSRWAASAAVIAAMTAGALDVNDEDQPTSSTTSAVDNGPADDGTADVE